MTMPRMGFDGYRGRAPRKRGGGSGPKFAVTQLATDDEETTTRTIVTPDMLSSDQALVFDALMAWCKADHYGAPMYQTMGGLAGTGKTTLVAVLANELKNVKNAEGYPMSIKFAAFTGKAASVLGRKLRQAGVDRAECSTLHSLMYRPKIHAKCDKDCKDPCRLKGQVDGWELKPDLECDLVVVDEASMLSKPLWGDLQSFGVPILAVGDHGQLPPIGDNPGLMENPHWRLEQIHRQAVGNPIIELAHHIRNGGHWQNPPPSVPRNDPRLVQAVGVPAALDMLPGVDPLEIGIITGRNRTRIRVNNVIRERIGHGGPAPDPGDIVIALKNAPPVFNGLRGVFNSATDYQMDEWGKFEAIIDLPDDGLRITGGINFHQFGREKTFAVPKDIPGAPSNWRQGGLLFDYGFAITCHKAQGSQFDNAIVITSDVFGDSDTRKRWLYTAVTRAAEKLILI